MPWCDAGADSPALLLGLALSPPTVESGSERQGEHFPAPPRAKRTLPSTHEPHWTLERETEQRGGLGEHRARVGCDRRQRPVLAKHGSGAPNLCLP